MIKRIWNYLFGKGNQRELIDLMWMDLKEIDEPEVYEMEGYDKYREYYSGKVYLKDVTRKGPYCYEIWSSVEGNIDFKCSDDSITIFRNEEVLRAIQ